jgi:L-rhamnose isomerase
MVHRTLKQSKQVERSYLLAKARYAELGVDTGKLLDSLVKIPISLQCWQGDDVTGFENLQAALSGGLVATGNYRGKARSPDELREDAAKALSLIPGTHRFNLHAIYGEFDGKRVDRDEIEPAHFKNWIGWAKSLGIGLDFNPTCFSHPKSASGFTLSHPDKAIRAFWIEHCQRSREIGAAMGKALQSATVTNIWVPDGMKDTPADRRGPRERLADSLDEIFSKKLSPSHNLDAVEGKLFGIGMESYTVGMHEFYIGYAVTRGKMPCLDSGHFHPTENVADKLSSVLCFLPEVLLHVSRGVRWDSDHVVILNDDLLGIAQELVRGDYLQRVRIGLDYFDASINRVAAWVIGARNMIRALCIAMLEPHAGYKALELKGDFTGRLALMEEAKMLPFGAVWDYYCLMQGVPCDNAWLAEVRNHERDVLSGRK